MMSHSQPFRNRRCSYQIGFGVRMGLGTPSFSPDLCSRFSACWMMLVFVFVPHKFLSVACGCACEALAFPAPWQTFCSTACTCQSVGLVGAADVCPPPPPPPPPPSSSSSSSSSSSLFNYILSLLAIIGIITQASVSSLEFSCFKKYSGAPQGHHVIFHAKRDPPGPLPHIYHCYISYIIYHISYIIFHISYIIYHISLLHPRWDEQCRDTMMTVPPQLTSSLPFFPTPLPSFSYPASFRHPPPASSNVLAGFQW